MLFNRKFIDQQPSILTYCRKTRAILLQNLVNQDTNEIEEGNNNQKTKLNDQTYCRPIVHLNYCKPNLVWQKVEKNELLCFVLLFVRFVSF